MNENGLYGSCVKILISWQEKGILPHKQILFPTIFLDGDLKLQFKKINYILI